MSFVAWTVTHTIKGLTRLICRIDDQSLDRVPNQGPLILVCNHINFLEVPLMYTHLQPRPVTGFAKSETWENPLLAPLFDLWGAIPLQRGKADLGALRVGLQALEQGKIVAVTPEGTRSGDGRLRKGHPGIVFLAQHSSAPILPLVYYGSEAFHQNFRRLRRTDFHIRIGEPFCVVIPTKRITHAMRQAVTDEIMYQLARLLPAQYRGYYSDLSGLTTHYLLFVSLTKPASE